ncbi:hypothetical protein M7I_1184 [Glarea lozoyensis 74030]|uniref:Uncharacterized protein n=1 Tax=Glarea lozoyensis (strain ATCC 74030 / MF5533) TaxID=1104152 RepID=H0EFB3_GLAL7|nr:hypothetical protein M7I_1184 [Glarea lozoyensis 74030]
MSVPAPAPPPPAASQFAPAESSASAEAQERGTKRTRPSEPASAPAPARAPAPAPAPPAPVVPNLAPIAPPTRLSSGPGKGKGKRPLNGGSYPLTPPPSPLTPKKLNPLSCKREKTKKTTKEVYRVIQLKQGKKRFGKVEPKRRKQDEKNDILNRFEKQIEYREAAVGRMDCRSDYLGFGRRDVA